MTGSLLGAYAQTSGGTSKVYQQTAVTNLESTLGRTFDVDNFYARWETDFNTWRPSWDVQNGRIPMISWNGTYLSQILNGSQDSLIRTRADGLKAAGGTVFLRWFWEMDADKEKGTRISSPSQYIAAWRRLHDIFTSEGATNVKWVWCPNAWSFSTGEAQTYYPGSSYVDWICADSYNWAPARGSWTSFSDMFAGFNAWASTQGKPLMVGETGVQERDPGEKAAWISAMQRSLKSYPAIKALLYFDAYSTANFGGMYDWRLDTSTSSLAAFKGLAADPYFNQRFAAVDSVPPSQPLGLAASVSPDGTRVDITWQPSTDNVGVSGYNVFRDGAPIAPAVPNTIYSDAGLSPGSTHSYSVRATDGVGNTSQMSGSISVTLPQPVQPTQAPPPPPSGAMIFSDGFESGTMGAWTTAAGLGLQSGDSHSGTWSAVAESAGSIPSYATESFGSGYFELYTNTWFKIDSHSSFANLLRLQSSSSNVATLFVGASGNLMLRNDAYPANLWSTTVVTSGAWHQVQIRVLVKGATSQTQVWYDGQLVGTLSTTLNLGTSPMTRLIIGDNVNSRVYRILFDDVSVSTAFLSS